MKGNYHLSHDDLSNERVFVANAQANPEQFEVLYNKYFESLFRFIYLRVDNKDIAFDLCEQVFLSAMTNIRKYVFRDVPFSSWLFRIAINEIADFYRKSHQQQVINTTYEQLSQIIDTTETDDTESNIEQMLDALQSMQPHEIHIIELRFFEKRSFKEIGEILSITENNAKVKLYRVLDKLKNILLNQ